MQRHEQINVFATGFDINAMKNMVAVVKDIDPHEEGKKRAKTMLDDFLIGMAVGEDKIEEVKQKHPKLHIRDQLERIVIDSTGIKRPKFVDPRTGKAFKPKVSVAPSSKSTNTTSNGVFVLDLGAAKEKPKKEVYSFTTMKDDVRFARQDSIMEDVNEIEEKLAEIKENAEDLWYDMRDLRDGMDNKYKEFEFALEAQRQMEENRDKKLSTKELAQAQERADKCKAAYLEHKAELKRQMEEAIQLKKQRKLEKMEKNFNAPKNKKTFIKI